MNSVLKDIIHLLTLINDPPNIRNKPKSGDIEGDFDYWFDGGSMRNVTGFTEYLFDDGSHARIPVVPNLTISIHLAIGKNILLQEEKGKQS